MLEYLPKKETHYVIWEEVVRMSANPIIATEHVTLLEILDRLIMPSLRASQLPETGLGFSSGYLARKRQVLRNIQLTILMDVEPDFAMPLTAHAMNSNLTAERAEHYQNNVVKPLTSAIVTALKKHGVRWFKFPLAFGMGADPQVPLLFLASVWTHGRLQRSIPLSGGVSLNPGVSVEAAALGQADQCSHHHRVSVHTCQTPA